jgi:peptide chain release factor 2
MQKSEIQEVLSRLEKKIQSLWPSLGLEEKKEQRDALQTQTQNPDFWSDTEKAQNTTQKIAHLEKFIQDWEGLKSETNEYQSLLEISENEDLKMIESQAVFLSKKFDQIEAQTLLNGEYDDHEAILSIHTGNGGQDAEDFSQMLYRMYLRWAEQKGLKVSILDESLSDGGLKSATIEIHGPMIYGNLKSEHGVHRLIRQSPFNAKGLRQTSFSRVEVLPKIETDEALTIDEKDLKIDVFRSSGAGGQSVNTTDSAVRITYLPLQISVTCQNERSQHQNKANALSVLQSRLAQLKLEQQAQTIDQIRGDLLENSFGSQIRTYTLHPYKMAKDHRTDYEENNPERVFDGEIDGFIEAFLRK